MANFTSIVVHASKGDEIKIVASEFRESDVQVQLLTQEDFDRFQQSSESGDNPVLIKATALTSLTPKKTEWLVTVEDDDDWHILYQPWRAHVTALTLGQR